MNTKKSEDRLFEQLQRLFIKNSFKKTISEYRRKIGIPADGFNSNKEYRDWIKEDEEKFLDIGQARVGISNHFGFPLNFSVWIEAYLVIGNKFEDFDFEIPVSFLPSRGFEEPGFCCALEKDPDFQCINIKVFPGASYREIKKFIKGKMPEIEAFLNAFDRKVHPIRKRRQAERDSKIYECYKNGWLDRYGNETIGIDNNLIPDFIDKIDMDMRRKIITEQIKMRK